MYRYLTLSIHLAICLYSAAASSVTPVMVVMHSDSGYSPALRPYMKGVLRQALDLTLKEFGPYRIDTTKATLSGQRAKIEAKKGKILNVLFSSRWEEDESNPSNMVEYNFPGFNDLLGMRALLVNKDTHLEDKISNRKDLTLLRAGQGQFWEDVNILRHNGIPVTEAHIIDALYPMLNKGRFDYIPLSVLEAEMALAERAHQFRNIHILPNFYIFYPIKFNLYVNKKENELAARFKLGLERTTENLFISLFNSYFPDLIFSTQPNNNKQKNKLFIAYNPNISESENKEITKRFLDNYGDYFTILE